MPDRSPGGSPPSGVGRSTFTIYIGNRSLRFPPWLLFGLPQTNPFPRRRRRGPRRQPGDQTPKRRRERIPRPDTSGPRIRIGNPIKIVLDELLMRILRRAEELDEIKELERQEAEIERELERRKREAGTPLRTIPGLPETTTIPEPQPEIVTRPGRRTFPIEIPQPEIEFPPQSPQRIPETPGEISEPRLPKKFPTSEPAPAPAAIPGGRPRLAQILIDNASDRLTFGQPATNPVNRNLTRLQTSTVPSFQIGSITGAGLSPQLALNPQPELNRRRRCKKCKEDEIRDKCFKGLYTESAGDIDYKEWQEIDCVTGRDVKKPKALQDAEIIEFPKLKKRT